MIDYLINLLISIFGNALFHGLMTAMQDEDTTKTTKPIQTLMIWAMFLLIGIGIGASFQSCSFTGSPFESQVRQWADDYPTDLRNKWAWCYLDSAANWSTDQKLREDVRLKSVQVLTESDRLILTPLDNQIKAAIPKQKTPLQQTYQTIGHGLQTAAWSPPPEPPPVKRRQTADGRRQQNWRLRR